MLLVVGERTGCILVVRSWLCAVKPSPVCGATIRKLNRNNTLLNTLRVTSFSRTPLCSILLPSVGIMSQNTDDAAAKRIARSGADPGFAMRAAAAARRRMEEQLTEGKQVESGPPNHSKAGQMPIELGSSSHWSERSSASHGAVQESTAEEFGRQWRDEDMLILTDMSIMEEDVEEDDLPPRSSSFSKPPSGTDGNRASTGSTGKHAESHDDNTIWTRFRNELDSSLPPGTGSGIGPGCLSDNSALQDTASEVDSECTSDLRDALVEFYGEHAFSQLKATILQTALAGFDGADAALSPSSSGSTFGTANTDGLRGSRASASRASASQLSKRYNWHSDDEGEENGQFKKRRKVRKPDLDPRRCLACPFAKKDPIKYRQCYKYTITRIQDVESHLYRHHEQPIYCACCKDTFETEVALRSHAEANCCSPRHETVDGVDRDQRAQLRRRVPAKVGVELQWFTVFYILFPHHLPRPRSPYIDLGLASDLCSFQDYMASEGASIMFEALQAHGLALPATGQEYALPEQVLRMAIVEAQEVII